MTSERAHDFDRNFATTAERSTLEASEPQFIRGEGQLAVYREHWNPTGHKLTKWEATQAYGEATIEEALEYGSAILRETRSSTKDALAKRRIALGLDQRTVANAARVAEEEVVSAESLPAQVDIGSLESIAFVLGLDERFVAFRSDCGGDTDLGMRLKTLQSEAPGNTPSIPQTTAALLAEAASVIRVQHRLQKWLGFKSESDQFKKSHDYGSYQSPAWRVGYRLAQQARAALELGTGPIPSMRELVEKRLGIPVIQAGMNQTIAGATVANTDEEGNDVRGVVLNIDGENANVWVRRATLAHELGHLLYDPDDELKKVRVDSYQNSQLDPQTRQTYYTDYVEQRANAFAIAFLAPLESVRKITSTPVKQEDVDRVMSKFGISHTAARYHIGNCLYRQYEVPEGSSVATPSDEWKAIEDFAVDYFPLIETSNQRRGKYSGLVAGAYEKGLISDNTAALYLQCDHRMIAECSQSIRELSGI